MCIRLTKLEKNCLRYVCSWNGRKDIADNEQSWIVRDLGR